MEKDFPVSGWSSLAVHGGHKQDPLYAHQVPIYATSTFVYDNAEQGMRRFSGEEEGYIYSRWGNPTITEAEDKIAALETFQIKSNNNSSFPVKAIVHSSGMAAISTLMMATLKAGDSLLTHYSLYGGTDELLEKVLPSLNITANIVDLRDLDKAETAMRKKKYRMLYLETPANPTIQCVDIEALCKLARKYDTTVACDNTFASPYLQQPFRYGADFVVHSTTKFLNGHGTAIGGVLLGKDVDLMKGPVTKVHRLLGNNASPFDAFLLIQGIKTLELRMERHCSNAADVANFLEKNSCVAKVNYAGLNSHPDHIVARKQMRHPGGMLSFELEGGLQAGINFMNRLKMCVRTVSLGTCDTLLSHPASMSHAGIPKEQRQQYGITDGLIRMNVGIENVQDIIVDLEQALHS